MIDYYVRVIIGYSESILSSSYIEVGPTLYRAHFYVRVKEYTPTLPNKFLLCTNTILTWYTRGHTHEWLCVCVFGIFGQVLVRTYMKLCYF